MNIDLLIKKLSKYSTAGNTIRLEIPLRLPPKARPRMTERRGKRWWFTPSSKDEEEVGLYASKIMRENGWDKLAGKIRLSATIYIKGRRRADLSNYLKALEDALEDVCYYNDIQISEYGWIKVIDRAKENKIVVNLLDLGKIE